MYRHLHLPSHQEGRCVHGGSLTTRSGLLHAQHVRSCVSNVNAACNAAAIATGHAAAGGWAAAASLAGHPAPAVCRGCDGAAQAGTPAASTHRSAVHCALRWRDGRRSAQGPGRRARAGSRCSAPRQRQIIMSMRLMPCWHSWKLQCQCGPCNHYLEEMLCLPPQLMCRRAR